MKAPVALSLLGALSITCCTDTDPLVTPSRFTLEFAPKRLSLEFEPVPFETSLSYVTNIAFEPGDTGRFIAIDLYGGFEYCQMNSDRADVLLAGAVEDVFTEYDAGMLGLAIDPGFAQNGYFYMAYNTSGTHVVMKRYTLDVTSAQATLESAQEIFVIDVQASPRWHNISSMGFEDDEVMWMFVGDKGISKPSDEDLSVTVAQDPTNPLGTLVRIIPSRDPDAGGYAIPPAAPLFAPGADLAVYAVGIRSPWKALLHEGRWYYGDVGGNDIEEVNIIDQPGLNLGWPVVEGPCADDIHNNSPDCDVMTDPWIHYGRASDELFISEDEDAVPTGRRSVYVGWIYQPNAADPYDGLWNDVLVWGDAIVGFLRAAPLDGDGDGWHLGHVEFPGGWAQGPDGYVYMVGLSDEPNADEPQDVSGLPSPLYRALLAR